MYQNITISIYYSFQVKQAARENVFVPAAAIVEETLKEMVSENSHSLPNPERLTRIANRHREKLRPADPQDIDFQVIFNSVIQKILNLVN